MKKDTSYTFPFKTCEKPNKKRNSATLFCFFESYELFHYYLFPIQIQV